MKKPTKAERARADLLARLIAPEAWKEYDAGNGQCTNAAGATCIESLKAAQRIVTGERERQEFTARELRIIRSAERLIDATERCARWNGTGSTRQRNANEAREKARGEWCKITRQDEESPYKGVFS